MHFTGEMVLASKFLFLFLSLSNISSIENKNFGSLRIRRQR